MKSSRDEMQGTGRSVGGVGERGYLETPDLSCDQRGREKKRAKIVDRTKKTNKHAM